MSSDTQEIDDLETRWPQASDRLFTESSWASDAHVVRDPSERFYRMPTGYKRAGDILIDQAMSDLADRPNLVYAALFCYRQSLELLLKKLIETLDHGKQYSPPNTHELSRLWKIFMRIVHERQGAEPDGLSIAARLVEEMHEADRRSDGFRFPADRDRAPFVFGDRGIDLANLREVMQGLVNLLECAYAAFEHQDEIACEMRQEWDGM